MPRASRRLAVLLAPADPDADPGGVLRAWAALRGRGLAAGWRLGQGPAFLSNQQGGFAVHCPVDGRSVARPFGVALEAWRAGGPRALRCPCGAVHDLAAVAFSPPAAFAVAWLEEAEAETGEVAPEVLALVEAAMGPVKVVLRRY
jgi:hypothetical protein